MNLKDYAGSNFIEKFAEYDFSGSTVSSDPADGQVETLDVNQGSSKVDIIFQEI